MLMTKLKIKGGYGEHGRSCFMIEYKDKHYIMFDCGILDTDPFPYPNITDEEAINTDFLFLSHAHKDHSGAIDHLIYKGFSGWILGTKQTIDFSHIEYDKIPHKTKNKDFVLYGGEDYSLVICIDEDDFNNIEGLIKIGTCKKGSSVYIDNEKIEYKSFDHFE